MLGTALSMFLSMEASKIVNAAIIGMDFETIVVNSKVYIIQPPTIWKISGAAYYLEPFGECSNLAEGLNSLKEIKSAATALSWFIQGDEALTDELCHGTLEEIAEGLEVAFSLIGVGNFIKLSGLAKNVATLTAKQKS